jgi:hypothetical protein
MGTGRLFFYFILPSVSFDLCPSASSFPGGRKNQKPQQPCRADRLLPIIHCLQPSGLPLKRRRRGLCIDQIQKINRPKPRRGDTEQMVRAKNMCKINCLDCASAVFAAPTELGIWFDRLL